MRRELGIDIQVKLHPIGPQEMMPYSVFRQILDSVSSEAYQSEKEDLQLIQEQFPHLPSVAFDAAYFRIRKQKDAVILLKELRPGSFVVEISLAGLAIWILKETVGETLKGKR